MHVIGWTAAHELAALLALVPAALNVLVMVLVLAKGKRDAVRSSFAALVGALTAWQLSDGLVRLSGDAASAAFWASLLSFGALMIGPAGIHFTFLFTGRAATIRKPWVLSLVYGPALVIAALTQAGMDRLVYVPDPVWGWRAAVPAPPLNTVYGVWIGSLTITMLALLASYAARTPRSDPRRAQAFLVAGGFAVPTFQGILTQILFPVVLGLPAFPIASTLMTTFSVAAFIALSKYRFLSTPTAEERLDEAQADLDRERRTLAAAERIAHLGSWEFDYATQRVTWSREMYRLFGEDPEKFHPGVDSISARMDPEDHKRFVETMRQASATGEGFSLEHRIVSKDGQTRWIVANVEIELSANGRPLRASGTSQDITHRVEAQEALRKSESMLVEAQRIAHVGNWLWDLTTSSVEWSDEMYRIYGYEVRSFPVTFEKAMERVVPEDRSRIREDIAQDLKRARSGDLSATEYRVQFPDGSFRTLRGQGRLEVNAQGRPVRMIGTVQDVTELKQAEEARHLAQERLSEIERLKQVDQFKTQLLNTASHELNTPLTPIKLQVHLLKAAGFGALNEAQRHALDIVDRNMERMGVLVRNMLDVGRIQGGRIQLKRTEVDLGRLMADAVEAFSASAGQDGILLEGWAEEAPRVWADASRITQVLFNLLSNALKFTPRGGAVKVWSEKSSDHVTIRVRDTGTGLTDAQSARLFQPFTQVHDGPQTAKRPGTGLGLYISREIVQLHGGRMWVESAGPGQGSTFSFELPLVVSLAPRPRAEATASPAAPTMVSPPSRS